MRQAKVPVLLISSQDDRSVSPRIMVAFADQLRARGVAVTSVPVPGIHGRALHESVAVEAVRRFTARGRW